MNLRPVIGLNSMAKFLGQSVVVTLENNETIRGQFVALQSGAIELSFFGWIDQRKIVKFQCGGTVLIPHD